MNYLPWRKMSNEERTWTERFWVHICRVDTFRILLNENFAALKIFKVFNFEKKKSWDPNARKFSDWIFFPLKTSWEIFSKVITPNVAHCTQNHLESPFVSFHKEKNPLICFFHRWITEKKWRIDTIFQLFHTGNS